MSSKTIDIELVYSFSLYFMSVVYIEKITSYLFLEIFIRQRKSRKSEFLN